jgi:hypothetical protein
MLSAARLIGRLPTAKNALLFQAASEGATHVLGQLSPVRKLTLQAVLLAYCTQDGVWQFRASVGGVAAASRFPALNPVREVALDPDGTLFAAGASLPGDEGRPWKRTGVEAERSSSLHGQWGSAEDG